MAQSKKTTAGSSRDALPKTRSVITAKGRPGAQTVRSIEQAQSQHELVDAKTAMALLDIKAQTLYAYVSRGLIRTAPKLGSKESRYFLEDLDAVKLKGRRVAGDGAPAERFLRVGGSAVLHTSITAIGPKGPSYRGRLAADLAKQHRCFEDCVELLWAGVLPTQRTVWKAVAISPAFLPFTEALSGLAHQNSSRRLMALTAEAYGACAGRNAELTLGAPVLAARQLIQVLAPVFGLLGERPAYVSATRDEPIAALVARSCGLEINEEVLSALDACLVLCADHELAPSTFAARIAASAGADIFACVNSALGAFEGPFTGMGCDEAENQIFSARTPNAFVQLIKRKRECKEPISGFGHPLYPDGDPRAALLIKLAKSLSGRHAGTRAVIACVDAVHSEIGVAPNLAMGLVAVSTALGLPRQSPGALMALGRTAGWVAHAFEQRLAGFLVRPRAKYIGPMVA